MSPTQFAERLGVAVSMVRDWIKSGELKADDLAKTGSSRPRWNIPEEAVRRFEEEHSTLEMLKKSLKATKAKRRKKT